MRRSGASALGLCMALIASASDLAGQGVRGSAVSSAHMVEIRPLRADTIAAADLVTGPDGLIRVNGQVVSCRPLLPCIVFRPADAEQALSFTQDLRLTAWGFGVTGLSATTFLRIRSHAGDDYIWPRADEAFDAMIAYVEYDRAPVRLRLGRQSTFGGLGFASYDGGSILVRRGPQFSAEVYGGRSLARGLSEPRSEALQGFDNLVLDPSVLLLGAAMAAAPLPGLDLAARYQREVFADRSALASERASLEAVLSTGGPVRLSGSLDYDFARGHIGKSDVRARVALPRAFALEAVGRRYIPYFELWTIWGFFDPVAYHEAELALSWSRSVSVGLTVATALRRYEETSTNILGPEIERDTRRFSLAAWWRPLARVSLDGGWRYETGFGSTLGRGDLAIRFEATERASIYTFLTAFQQAEEFRVGRGSVLGAGLGGRLRVGARTTLEAGASLYDQASTRPDTPDWTQRRAWASLRIDVGRDPGLRAGAVQ